MYRSIEKYLLGSKELLTVDVSISNYGEDAFEAGFYMTIPAGLNFRKIERIGDTRKIPITCTAPSIDTNNTLKCDIGNPLSSGQMADFKVIMMPSQKYGMAPSYDFYMEANSTNVEIEGTSFDNIIRKSIGIWVETDLSINGKASNEDIHYNVSEYMHIDATHEYQIGPQVVSSYEIRNGGPSTIEETEIFLLIPYETNAGDALMYLLNQPETSGNIRCEPTMYANQRNLVLNETLVRKSYLESLGAIERSSLHGSGQAGHSASGSAVGNSGTAGSTFHHYHRTTSTSVNGGKTMYTEEERRKLDAEENEESTGDASYVHRQRAGQASGTYTHQNMAGETSDNQGWSGPSSGAYVHRNITFSQGPAESSGDVSYVRKHNNHSDSINRHVSEASGTHIRNGPTVTYTTSRNRTSVQGPDGRLRVTEHSSTGNAVGAGSTAAEASQTNIHHDYPYAQNREKEGQNSDAYAGQFNGFTQNGHFNTQVSPTVNTARRRMMSQQDGEPPRPDLITGVSQMEKVAQGGRGFQTSSLDLGIYRGNVEDGLATGQRDHNYRGSGYNQNYSSHHNQYQKNHQAGGTAGMITYGRGYSSGGGAVDGGGKTASTTTTATGGTEEEYEENYSDDLEEEYYGADEEKLQNAHHSQHATASTAQQQSAHRHTIAPDQQFKHYQRLRREVLLNFNDLELDEALRCNTTRCAILRCTAGPLETDSVAWISIRTRLVATTMNTVAPNVPLNLSTMVVARVSKLPYIGSPQEKPLKRHEVVITARPIPDQKSDVVPLWVVVLSACAGVIILLLLIYVLYKVN